MKLIRHIAIVFFGLFLFLVLPGLFYYANAGGHDPNAPDAVSSASVALPDQPSGEFIVIVNRDKHALTVDDWTLFFQEKEVGVIMEDISALAVSSDAAGLQLARRYQARLAENQMTLTEENSLLVVSRAENGLYDVIVLSREMADALDFSAVCARDDAQVITIQGAQE